MSFPSTRKDPGPRVRVLHGSKKGNPDPYPAVPIPETYAGYPYPCYSLGPRPHYITTHSLIHWHQQVLALPSLLRMAPLPRSLLLPNPFATSVSLRSASSPIATTSLVNSSLFTCFFSSSIPRPQIMIQPIFTLQCSLSIAIYMHVFIPYIIASQCFIVAQEVV